MAAGILSDQIKLYACAVSSQAASYNKTTIKELFTGTSSNKFELENLQSVPSLGGSRDNVEITCLSDTVRQYIPGLKDYGDALEFAFLYDNEPYSSTTSTGGNYAIMNRTPFLDANSTPQDVAFQVKFKEGECFYFVGKLTTAMNEIAVGDALTFNASIALHSDIWYDERTV